MAIKAGFARRNITPPNGLFMAGYYHERNAEGTLDALNAHCIAFSDGERTAVVFSIDIIGMNQKLGDELRNIVAKAAGIPYEAVYFACTHTHTGPTMSSGLYHGDPEYNSIMFRLCADAAVEAIADLSDAKVYTALGEVKNVSFIRRFKMKDGKTCTNPRRGDPDIAHPISTPDESLRLVRITREGKDDIVILNFQTHPDVIGGCFYSSDWPGWTERCFEGAVPNTKCVLFNGCQGDTNHIDVSADSKLSRKGYDHSRHMGMSIAGEAMKLYTYADEVECDKVGFAQKNIEVPSNRARPEQIPEAERIVELHETGRDSEIKYTGSGMEHTTIVAEAYRMKRLKDGPDSFTLYLTAVRFGDIVFSGIPGEPFTDIGRGIKSGSPFGVTMPCCCANGSQAYFPMLDAYEEGGYEARSSSFAAGTAERIIEGSVEMLKELY